MTKDQIQTINTEYDAAKQNFLTLYKPEFDRAYKLFSSYTGDRAKQLEKTNNGEIWQSNVFIPQIFSYIKTFLQKTVGVTPDFTIKGEHSEPLKEVIQWLWEVGMSEDMIDYFLQVFITGNTIGKDFLKKQIQKKKQKEVGVIDKIKKLFTKTKNGQITYTPDFDPVDLYNFYIHPRAKKISDPFRKFQRYVITVDEAKRIWSDVKDDVWAQFKDQQGGDVQDYAYVRKEVLIETYKSLRETTTSSAPYSNQNPNIITENQGSNEKLIEFVEAWTDEEFIVFAPMSGTPIIIKEDDNPYDYGETPFRQTKFFPRPFQFYGMGIPKMIEHLNELLNSNVNQRHDSVTLSLHGLIAAAPSSLPGYKSSSFKFGPGQVLWTNDPRSIQYIRQGEVPQSAYLEEDKIKEAMRIAVGIDDYTTTQGADIKQTATVATFMREATLEGVKLFLIMLRSAYRGHFDHFISMIQQYWTVRSVVPRKALAILDDHSDIDFPVTDENWIGPDGKHLLFPDEYEVNIEQSSTLATSMELAKTKDRELWDTIKDLPDDMIDPETGKVYSIKKFKILQKIIEDYGWEKDEYVVEKRTPEINPLNPAIPTDLNSPTIPQDTNSNNPPLVGNAMGANLGAAMQ